jgi:hypothetical protein
MRILGFGTVREDCLRSMELLSSALLPLEFLGLASPSNAYLSPCEINFLRSISIFHPDNSKKGSKFLFRKRVIFNYFLLIFTYLYFCFCFILGCCRL